ncbi:MAG: hypothetical protein DWI63_01845 [Chloroflexi bacterium]|nr:MAG: hypothetical protein DWI63_01845 [Chloroflexota bacterium]
MDAAAILPSAGGLMPACGLAAIAWNGWRVPFFLHASWQLVANPALQMQVECAAFLRNASLVECTR